MHSKISRWKVFCQKKSRPFPGWRLFVWVLVMGGLPSVPTWGQDHFVRPDVARELPQLGTPPSANSAVIPTGTRPSSQMTPPLPHTLPSATRLPSLGSPSAQVHRDSQNKLATHVAPTNSFQPHLGSELPTGGAPTSASVSETAEPWRQLLGSPFAKIDWKKMLASLALVIGGYLAFLALVRWFHPPVARGRRALVEVVGQTRLNSQQTLQVVRLGNKLVMLLAGKDNAQALSEISDPLEVEELLAQFRSPGFQRTPPVAFSARRVGEGKAADSASLQPMMEQLVKTLQQAVAKQTVRGTEYEA